MITKEEARKLLEDEKVRQAKYYPVIVDGNTHHLGVRMLTKREAITNEKCADICARIYDNFGIAPTRIVVMMSEYDLEIPVESYISALYGDGGLCRTLNQQAIFCPKSNCLQIWVDDMPVHENCNGVATDDADALADCLL